MLDIKKTLTKMLTSYFGKTLWTGTASANESITVPDTAEYIAFIVLQNNNPILTLSKGTVVDGFGYTGNASNGNQYHKVFRALVSGNTWTISYAKEITHAAGGNHGNEATQSITKVIGLLPNWGGIS